MMAGASLTTTAWTWAATGTTWQIHHSGGVDQATAAAVAAAVAADEQRWSRFLSDSDVGRLNAGAGEWVGVDAETLDLLEVANGWVGRSGGVFQPLVGGVLAAWGYDRSLAVAAAYAATSPARRTVGGLIGLDWLRGRARVPAGTRLDLGGIAKSWMAVRAAAIVRADTHDPHVLVDAGGDLVAARGDHNVNVERPLDPDGPPLGTVRLGEGQGIATSGFGRRSWRNGDDRAAHHLIDPALGEPGIAAHATVISDDPVAADVRAKILALRPELIETMSEAALVVVDGRARTTAGWTWAVPR
jgi:thiamine biosynthesis lipoprotein